MPEKNYRISVVTPFHNVDIDMFRYAYESLQKQTLGFQNIQWIVVVHNTDAEHKAAVHQLLDGQENIIIEEAENDVHTPSSPRNIGMQFATAPYLGFLDADDGYTPECLETALRHLQKTASDIVVFRREYEMEKEGLMPATEIVLWDQTREEIVMDRENWDDQKMFGGLFWGMVTSRLYSREFITRYGFTFDETVPFTEDVLFLIELYGKARRVCYLPQLIGYHYFINSHSLVQSMAQKSGETLVSYAAGFKKIFEAAYRNGIYIDELMAMLLSTFAAVMIQAKGLSLSQREEIKEILEPYVHAIRMLPVTKLISAEKAKHYYTFPRDVILHPENFDQGGSVKELRDGQDTLMEILTQNKDTDYGRRYHFSNLRTMEGYQARVPLAGYATYAPLIKLQTRIGESGIFTSSPIPCYLLTGGPSGEPHLLPATPEHLKPYREAFAACVRGKVTFLLGESLPRERKYNDQAALNSITGWVLTDFYYQEQMRLSTSKARFTAPSELLFPPKALSTIYLRLLFALREREVEQILAPFTWGVLEAFCFLEKHWQNLCRDLEEGRINFALDVPKDFLSALEGRLTPEPERAKELRQIFEQGFTRPVATLIWPKLKRVISIGSGSFTVYTRALKKYLGDLPHSNGFLSSSMALLGKAMEGSDLYELITGQNFYEFRPVTSSEDERPLFISELQAGQSYELILTNRAGLYRYATEDIITIASLSDGKVIFSYAGRKNGQLPLPQGSIREQEIYHALRSVAEAQALEILDFAYYLQEGESPRLHLMLEANDETKELEADMDRRLCETSEAYAASREHGLAACRLSYLAPESHLLYRDVQRFKYKTAPDQIKPVHYLDTREKIQFFSALLSQ